MAKKVSKAQAQAQVVPVQAPVAPTPAPVPVVKAEKVKAEKVVETAETKWARRLGRWAGKVQAAGLDPKKLMDEYRAS